MTFFHDAGQIFATVLLPILVIVGLGAIVQRFKPLDMVTLSRVQVYLFVPVFLFVRVFDSQLSGRESLGVAVAAFGAQVLLAIPVWLLLARKRVRRETAGAVLLSAVVFNAGNFGIPVAERAFGPQGGAVQAIIVIVANLTLWGIGYALMAAASGQKIGPAIAGYFKLPMVYALLVAFALRGLGIGLPPPISYSLHLVADGLVPLALITLGAQLTRQARWPRWRAVVPVLALKLVALPVVTAVLVVLTGLWPWPGACLIVASAGPTAVNTLLLAIEQNGDVELAADCVFWTTLCAAVTVTITLTVVIAVAPPGDLPHP